MKFVIGILMTFTLQGHALAEGFVIEALCECMTLKGHALAEGFVIEAYKSPSYRYLLALDPELLGQYSRYMGLGLPFGAVDPTAMTLEEMKQLLKKSKGKVDPNITPNPNPAVEDKAFQEELGNLKSQVEYFNRHAVQVNQFLNTSQIPANALAFRPEEIATEVSLRTADAVNLQLWFGLRSTQSRNPSGEALIVDSYGKNRSECFKAAAFAYAQYLTRYENFQWLSRRSDTSREARAFRLPVKMEDQIESLNPWMQQYLDYVGNESFVCSAFLEEVAAYLPAINFAMYSNDRDQLVAFEKLSQLVDDSSLMSYTQILAVAFSKDSAGPISRYLWLRANKAEKLDEQTSRLVEEWIQELKVRAPERAGEADAWFNQFKERLL